MDLTVTGGMTKQFMGTMMKDSKAARAGWRGALGRNITNGEESRVTLFRNCVSQTAVPRGEESV